MIAALALAALALAAEPAAAATAPAPAPAPAPATAPATAAAPARAVERVSFEEAMRRARLQATNAVVAAQEVRRAEALLGEARSSSLPLLALNGSYTRLDSERRASPPPAPPLVEQDALNGNASLQLPLVAPGRWVTWSHAREQVDVARASEADVRRATLVTAARAYLTVIGARRVVDVSRSAVDIARVRFDFAHARRAGGIGNAVDELRAEQQLAASQTQLSGAVLAVARAQEALGVLTGADGPLDATEDPTFRASPGAAPLADAERARLDAEVARARLAAAEHVAADSWVDWLPTLNLAAQAFYNDPSTITSPRTGWQVQFLLSLPLFEGGLRVAQERERSALADESRAALEGTLRQVRSDVRLAFEAVARREESLSSARLGAERAKRALELVTEAYRAGATNDLDVSTAQQQSRDADLAAVIAEDDVRQARLDLVAGLGQFP